MEEVGLVKGVAEDDPLEEMEMRPHRWDGAHDKVDTLYM